MSILELWRSSSQLREKRLQQIIAFAGEGELKDGGPTSREFRELLKYLSSARLRSFAEECLQNTFSGSGFALQDIVNEIGRRLGFEVENGRYRGTTSDSVGYDGLWHAPEGNEIVVEVKTSDNYRFPLDTVAGYRRELFRRGSVSEEDSSVLLVVGREDTGELEAQVRGSRHAWDMRLISVGALVRLVSIREELEDPRIAAQVRSVLRPREFTRVDGIIDLVFSTAEEILQEDLDDSEGARDAEAGDGEKKFTPVSFHEACVRRIEERIRPDLIRRSRATFESPDGDTVLICLVSREHDKGSHSVYWFAFYPHQEELLADADDGYLAFGCGSEDTVVLMPFDDFAPILPNLNQTHRDDGTSYWHVHIFGEDGRLLLQQKGGRESVEVTSWRLDDV